MTKNNIIAIFVIIIVILLAAVGFAMWNNSNNQNSSNITTENPIDTENPAVEAGAPSVVTNPDVSAYTSTVLVKGSVDPKGALTTYWYEYGTTSSLGTTTKVYLVGSGFTSIYTPAYITGLKASTNYYFRLSAQNSFGTVNGSTYTFKTNTAPAPTGTAPTTTTLAATDVLQSTANLNGRVNPNGAQVTYWFEYGTSANLGTVTSFQTGENNTAISTAVASVSNLRSATKYFYRLNAQNQFGTVNGEILNFTTKGPASPTAPTVKTNVASDITLSGAKLHGSVNPNGAATTYWFEYSTNSLLSNVVVSKTKTESLSSGTSDVNVMADIKNLQKDTKYYVVLVAKNQKGTVRGETVSFTTQK